MALTWSFLKNPTFAQSSHASFLSSECLVHFWRSALKRLYACVLLLIVVIDCLATSTPSKPYSLSSIPLSNSSAVSIECTSPTRRLTAFGASLSCCRSSRSSRVACKAGTIIPTTPAAILRGSVIFILLMIESGRETKTQTRI
jgi:hypothetical protein